MREGRQAQANKNKDERRFPFPFPPYAIQRQFMNEMYAVLDKGGLGIFESPTGTVRPCPSSSPRNLIAHFLVFYFLSHAQGKSLSIICSALQWLRDNENNLDLDDAAALDDKPTALQPTDTADKTNKKEEAAGAYPLAARTRWCSAYIADGAQHLRQPRQLHLNWIGSLQPTRRCRRRRGASAHLATHVIVIAYNTLTAND